ncbi:MAG TPA: hypothetical protein VHO67_06800 [Polyangia bacterium]|nr:hypothetical protein [Polyangia bacterium]
MTKSEKARPEQPEPPLLFVDAVEAETARLVGAGGAAFTVPLRLLPAGAKEGSWLRASFVLVDPPPDDGAQIRARLGRGDDGGDIKL